MLSRKVHRYVGLLMLAPLFAWAITGLIFFIKPGYDGAYEVLNVKTYPLQQGVTVPNNSDWQEARLFKSILGDHLLVKTSSEPLHLNPRTLDKLQMPNPVQLKRLFADTVSQNPDRYGKIQEVSADTAYTSTGIKVTLDWNTFTFSQQGRDREIIDLFYKIHYLQWTPRSVVNQVLGVIGLLFLMVLSGLGLKIYFSKKH